MSYRVPKIDISASGMRSWIKRHPHQYPKYPPGQALHFIYRELGRRWIEGMKRAMETQTQEIGWFR